MEASSSSGLRPGNESRAGVDNGGQITEYPSRIASRSISRSTTGKSTKNDPCWFLENVSLKTGTKIVALFGIFTHPAMMLTLLHYWFFGTTPPMRTGALALCCANGTLLLVNYILLVAARRGNPRLCLVWICLVVTFALVDFVIVIWFYNSIYFVLFQIIVFFITIYKLWVVVSYYLSLKTKKPRRDDESTVAKSIVTFAPSQFSMDSSRVVVIESKMGIH